MQQSGKSGIEVALPELRRRRSVKWTHYGERVLPAWVAEMDFALAEPIKDALTEAIAIGDTGYSDPDAAGLAGSLAGFWARRSDWEIDPERVINTANVVSGLGRLIELLTGPGERVVINPPVYHWFEKVISDIGRRVVEVPLTTEGQLDPDGIEEAFAAGAKALILCSPQNPLGTINDRDRLEAVADSAARHGAWVFADEIHAPLTLPGAEFVPFLTISENAARHGISLVSASKTFNLAGLGAAQMVIASDRAEVALRDLPGSARHAAHIGVLAATVAYSPACEDWLAQVIDRLDRNRGLLGDLLTEHAPEVGYIPPEAGYLAWLDFRELRLGADPAEVLLFKGNLALNPGPSFGPGGEGFARLNFGTSPDILTESMKRMEQAFGGRGGR